MGHFVLACNPLLDINVRRNPRAKRLSLRVSRLDGRVTLTLPPRVSDADGQAFLNSRANWLEKALGETLAPIEVAAGRELLLEGKAMQVRVGDCASPIESGGTIFIPSRAGPRILKRWLIERARGRASTLIRKHETQIGRRHTRLSLRDTRSRWGSCASNGAIMLSWRLIMAPSDVFEYVVAHEVAHLKEMNHSASFWATVGDLMPGYATSKEWLRSRGHELHRYRFD